MRILNRHVFGSAILLPEIYPTNILVKCISSRIFLRSLFIIANKLSIRGFFISIWHIHAMVYIAVFRKNQMSRCLYKRKKES